MTEDQTQPKPRNELEQVMRAGDQIEQTSARDYVFQAGRSYVGKDFMMHEVQDFTDQKDANPRCNELVNLRDRYSIDIGGEKRCKLIKAGDRKGCQRIHLSRVFVQEP